MDRKIDLLIAEDDPSIVEFLKTIIEEEGEFEVIYVANDGKDAYEKIKELRPKVVVTDLNLPNMSGMDMVLKIVEEYGEGEVEFMIVSGNLDMEIMRKFFSLGVYDFIKKPFEKDEFMKKLEMHGG